MPQFVYLIVFIFSCTISCQGQHDKLLIRQDLITDWSKYPIYPRLVNDPNKENDWKEEFQYMDDIELYGITYMSDGLKVNGLMVKPKKEGKYPCIIYNRGGNREFGALTVGRGAILLGPIAKEGYVVIASQYRGNGGGEGQEEFGGSDVRDITILPEVLKEIEQADTTRVGMYGWSRGGMMTYMAMTQMTQLKAVAVGGAKSDLTKIDRPSMETNVYAELIPNYAEQKEIELKKRSAIFWADQFPKDVPVLLLHGNADWRVKSTNSLRLALEFEKYWIPYRLKIFEGADHGIREFREEVNAEIIGWFDRYVKNSSPLPNMEFHGR